MKTKAEVLDTKVYVYARAKTPSQIEMDPDAPPYIFDVKDYDYGDERSVRIMEYPVMIPIPDGIDIREKCIENLKEQIEATRGKFIADLEDLNNRIRALALIEYKPESAGNDDGGFVPVSDEPPF